MKKQLFVVLLIVILVVLGIATGVVMATPPDNSNAGGSHPVACEADARICPDGTIVYRVPPSCQFEKCPK